MFRTISLQQWRYFAAAARHQNLRRAAKEVAISPSAVSTAIVTIEGYLGYRLFDRVGRTIVLNERGAHLNRTLNHVFDTMAAAETTLMGGERQMQGHYRLAGSPFLAATALAREWTTLQTRHPQLEAEIMGAHTADVVRRIANGDVDFGLCFSPMRRPDLDYRTLHRGQLRVVVRKRHPVQSGRFSDLSRYPAVMHKATLGVEACDNHPMLAKHKIKSRIRLVFDDDAQAIEAIAASDAWSLVPDVVAHAFRSRVVALPGPRGWSAPYEIASVIARRSHASPVLSALDDMLVDAWRKTAPRV